MGKKAPAAPDPATVANAQSAANTQAAIAQGYMNNPNTVTPYGTTSRTQNGSVNVGGQNVPLFTDTTTLSPAQQKQFDMTQALQEQALGIGGGVLNNVGSVTSKPFDISQAPAAPGSGSFTADRDATTKSIIDRNAPVMQRDQNSLQTQLTNQGIMPGSEAWKNAQDDLSRKQNDFNLAAIQSGNVEQNQLFGQAQTAHQTGVQDLATSRSQPINEYATLLGLGGNVQTPQYQNSNVNVAPPNVQGAYDTQYSGKLAGFNAQNQLYGNLISAGGMAGAGFLASDIRLKGNIHFEGNEKGYPIYTFSYRNDPEKIKYRGVMAQDVKEIMPEAVENIDGILAVNYQKIGIEFRRAD